VLISQRLVIRPVLAVARVALADHDGDEIAVASLYLLETCLSVSDGGALAWSVLECRAAVPHIVAAV
jgi:hypothetical protein